MECLESDELRKLADSKSTKRRNKDKSERLGKSGGRLEVCSGSEIRHVTGDSVLSRKDSRGLEQVLALRCFKRGRIWLC